MAKSVPLGETNTLELRGFSTVSRWCNPKAQCLFKELAKSHHLCSLFASQCPSYTASHCGSAPAARHLLQQQHHAPRESSKLGELFPPQCSCGCRQGALQQDGWGGRALNLSWVNDVTQQIAAVNIQSASKALRFKLLISTLSCLVGVSSPLTTAKPSQAWGPIPPARLPSGGGVRRHRPADLRRCESSWRIVQVK